MTNKFYRDTKDDVETRFDTNEYPKDHPAVKLAFKVGSNKALLGMRKDETAGTEITEFVGLRAKCYALNALMIS